MSITEYVEEGVLKPDRTPDYVHHVGHAYWFQEMVFMHVYGGIYKIHVNQEDSSFYIVEGFSSGSRSVPLYPGVKEAYDKWFYEMFESKLLGEDDGRS